VKNENVSITNKRLNAVLIKEIVCFKRILMIKLACQNK